WLFLFGIYFPEPFPAESRWAHWTRLKWVIIVPLALETACDLVVFIGGMRNYASVFWLNSIFEPFRSPLHYLDLAAIAGMFVCLAAKFRLASSRDAKRRLRLLFAGSAVGLGPVVTLFVISSLLRVDLEQHFPPWLFIPAYLLLFLFPVTLAYVIVVQRAMDVRVVIRQGLQYAIARRGVWVLRLLLVIVLAHVVLTILNRVGGTVLFYLIISAAAAVWFSLRWLLEAFGRWVDRQFFRETY